MHEYLAVFNMDTQERRVDIAVDASGYQTIDGIEGETANNTLTFSLPGLSYSLMKSNQPISYASIESVNVGNSYMDNNKHVVPVEVNFFQQQCVE